MKSKEYVKLNVGKQDPETRQTVLAQVVAEATPSESNPNVAVNRLRDGLAKWQSICYGLGWTFTPGEYEALVKTVAGGAFSVWQDQVKKVQEGLKQQAAFNPLEAAKRRKEAEAKRGQRRPDDRPRVEKPQAKPEAKPA